MKSFKGIPVAHRKAVASYMHIMGCSAQAAYARLRAAWEQQHKDKAAKDAADKAKRIEERQQWAREDVETALGNLAVLRDGIRVLTDDAAPLGFTTESYAEFLAALIEREGERIEKALYVLGIIERDKNGGDFAETFPALK